MKKKIIPLVILVLTAVGAFLFFRNRKPEQEGIIRVSGNIEITDAALSFKIPGRVEARLVSEGQIVKKGQIAARLDDIDLRQEVEVRRAELNAAQAALRELEAGSRPEEIGQAQAAVASAQAEQDRWRQEYERQQSLYQRDVISERELESSKMAFETSRAKVIEASKALKLVQAGPRKEKIEQAQAQVERANEALNMAETRLSYTTLISPIDGIVLTQNVESGEYITAGAPVVTVGKMDPVWLRAFIDETDLGRVRIGQQVRVKTDTDPDKTYAGKISFISSESEFTPKTVQTDKERVKLVYRIKIDIPNPELELKPGMPADGEIELLQASP
jgi:HlyD family secretion protein